MKASRAARWQRWQNAGPRLLRHLPWLLTAAAAPFYLFPSAHYWYGLLLLPLAGLAAWRLLGHPLPRTPLNPALLALLLIALASAWSTTDLALSAPKLAGLVFGAALTFLAAGYSTRRTAWRTLMAVLVLAGVGMALIGLTGMQRPLSEDASKIPALYALISRFPRVLSDLPGASMGINPNEVGGALLWVLLPGAALWLSLVWPARRSNPPVRADSAINPGAPSEQSPGEPSEDAPSYHKPSFWRTIWPPLGLLLLGAALALIGLTLLLSQSRAAYLGLAVGLLMMLILLLPVRLRRAVSAALLAAVLALTWLAAPYLPALYKAAIHTSSADLPGVLSTASLGARIRIWQAGLAVVRDFPLTGIGLNTFRYAAFHIFPMGCYAPPCDLGHAHNEFLQAALDLGLPGLLALLAIYLTAAWMLWKIDQYSRNHVDTHYRADTRLRWLALGLGGGLLAHFVYGWFDAITLGAKPAFLFWLLLGLICGLYQEVKEGTFRQAARGDIPKA